MRVKKYFLIILMLSVSLLFGTSCVIHRPRPHPRGQIISTIPYGRVNRERHEHRIIVIDERHERKKAHDAREADKKHRKD